MLTYCGLNKEGKTHAYTQIYNNGIIEAVSTILADDKDNGLGRGYHEIKLLESGFEYLNTYKELNVEMPVFIFLTLIGVKGYSMYPRPGERPTSFEHDYVIDRNILIVPEVLIEKYDEIEDINNLATILKPCFDSICQACGYAGSENYRDGIWSPKDHGIEI